MERDLLFLSRQDVERLLTPEACIAAVESAFRQYASGQAAERMLGLGAHDGSFHVKAGIVMGERPYFAPGTFVAAVGADDESKQEIEPSLLASAIVVTDITA